MRVLVFAIIFALVLIAWSASEHQAENNGLPLVLADYPVCQRVNPGPLKPAVRPNHYTRNSEISW